MGKKSDLAPLPPSRTPTARYKAWAKYRDKHRAMIKANPAAHAEKKERAKAARVKYEQRHKGTRMAKQTLRRDEALYKKLGKEQYYSAKAKKDDGPRDYDLEWLVYQDERGKTALGEYCGGTSLVSGQRVEAAFIKLMSSSTSSSQYYCLPPFHDEPQGCQEVIRQTVSCYLVTSPAANEARGVYAQWANAQRAGEAVPRGGAPNRQSYYPLQSPESTCSSPGSSSWQPFAYPLTCVATSFHCTSCQPHSSYLLPVGGGGAVHTSLMEALEVLEVVKPLALQDSSPPRILGMQRTLQLDIPMGRLKPSPMGNGSLRDCGPELLGIPFPALQAPVVKPVLCVSLSCTLHSPPLSSVQLNPTGRRWRSLQWKRPFEGVKTQTMEAMEADFNGEDLQEPACCGSSGSGLSKVSRPIDYVNGGSHTGEVDCISRGGTISHSMAKVKKHLINLRPAAPDAPASTRTTRSTTGAARSTRASTAKISTASKAAKGRTAAAPQAKRVSKHGKKAKVEEPEEKSEKADSEEEDAGEEDEKDEKSQEDDDSENAESAKEDDTEKHDSETEDEEEDDNSEKDGEKDEEEDSDKEGEEKDGLEEQSPTSRKPSTPDDSCKSATPDDSRKSATPDDSHKSATPEAPPTKSPAPENPPDTSSTPEDPPHKSPAPEALPAKSPAPENSPDTSSAPEDPPHKLPAPEAPPAKSPAPENPPDTSSAPEDPPHKSPAPEDPHKSPAPEEPPHKSLVPEAPPPKSPAPPLPPSPPVQNRLPTPPLPPPKSPTPPLPPASPSPSPPAKDKGKGKAVDNTLSLARKEKKAARAAMHTDVDKWHNEVDEKVKELAAKHHLPQEEVWRRAEELNKDKPAGERLSLDQVREYVKQEAADAWSADELVQLKIDYLAYKEAKEAGTRQSNAACAADATTTGERLHQELVLLEKRTGACGFIVITKGHVNNSIRPQILGTPANCKFVLEVLKMPIDSLPLKYERWATAEEDVKPAKSQGRRGEVVEMIRAGLNAMFGSVGQTMNYKEYRKVIQAGMGVELVGWPVGTPFEAPLTIGTGGAAVLDELWTRLKCKACHWADMSPEDHKAALKEYPKKKNNYETMWKPKREAVKAEEAKELAAAAAVKRAEKKRKREENDKAAAEGGDRGDGGDGGDEPPKKKRSTGGGGGKEQAPKASGSGGDGGTEKERKRQEKRDKKKEEKRKKKEAKRKCKAVEAAEGDVDKLKKKKKVAFALRRTEAQDESDEEDDPPKRPTPRPRPKPKSKPTISDSSSDEEGSPATPNMDPESIAAYLEKPNISTSSRSFFQNKFKMMLVLRESEASKAQMIAAAGVAGPSKPNKGKGKAKATPAPRKISAVNDDSDYEETIEVDYDEEPGADILSD
ncbi:hypothetical protein B0H13DRAFT_1888045 [Mycena leptocephala]|nr:hypothetical protein B0H13DRAFT_1888045 [Mycena leptocephala]